MYYAKSAVAVLLTGVLAVPGFSQTPEVTRTPGHGIFNWIARDYLSYAAPKVSFEDSPRLDKLMRAGNIYLSLSDAISLALENNLDIENARFVNRSNEANVLRASAGTLLRNVSTSISTGPSSASLGVLASTALGSGGTANASSGSNSLLSGLSVQLAGSTIPNLDPVFFINGQFLHSTTIETATNITGTNGLTTQYQSSQFGVQQGLLYGTTIQLGMNNQFGITQNSPYNQFNPYSQGTLSFTLQQNLLQGFRPSVNSRAIRQAKNNLHSGDLTFKNQVMATVYNVVNLYWDLVADIDSLKVRQRTLELDTKQYHDNKRKAELGAVAPIDIIQAEAEMKTSQQDVITARSQVEQQETTLKSVLTRGGLDNLDVITAHIVPTDHFDVPAQEAVRPVQDLIAEAIANRPDVEQSQITLENARLTTLGVKDALLPQLQAFVSASNSGVAGQVNAVGVPTVLPNGQTILIDRTSADVNPYFLGGYGSVLAQVFGRNFPNYSAGVSLTMTLRNRSARADLITDQLNYRQTQIQDRQLHNNIKLNVVNARTALANARSAYDTSVEARQLQDQTTAGTRRKYELGTATILDVVIGQRDATTRELSEVDARNQYVHSRVNLENVLGRILQDYDISIDEAKVGVVSRPPDMIPVVLPPPPPGAAPAGAVPSGGAPAKAVPGVPNNAAPASAVPANVVPVNVVPANSAPASAMPAGVLPANALPPNLAPANIAPVNAVPTNAVPSVAPPNVAPTNVVPAGVVAAGVVPANVPANGAPVNAVPTNVVPSVAPPNAALTNVVPAGVVAAGVVPANVPANGAPVSAVPTNVVPSVAPPNVALTNVVPASVVPANVPANGAPVNSVPANVAPSDAVANSVVSPSAVPANSAPAGAVLANAVPAKVVPTSLVPPNVAPANAAGANLAPANAVPTNAVPAGVVAANVPANGAPVNAVPTNVVPSMAPPNVALTNVVPTGVVSPSGVPANLAPAKIVPPNAAPANIAPVNVAPTNVVPTGVAPANAVPASVVPPKVMPAYAVPSNFLPPNAAPTGAAHLGPGVAAVELPPLRVDSNSSSAHATFEISELMKTSLPLGRPDEVPQLAMSGHASRTGDNR